MTTTNLLNTNSNDEVYEYTDDSGNIVEYDLNRLEFAETKEEKIPVAPNAKAGTKPMVNYRIHIHDRRADGRLQDLLIRTEELFTFGVSLSNDMATGALNGYSLPISLWNQDGATPSQKYLTDLIEKKILDKIKTHLVTVKKTFKQPGLEYNELKKMKMFYRKKGDDGTVSLDDPPMWYPKLIVSKKKDMKISTRFYQTDSSGNSCVDENKNLIELNPQRLIEKLGRVKAVIKIESVYIRSEGASIQCKVMEADYRLTNSEIPRKAKFNLATATVIKNVDNNPMSALMRSSSSSSSEEVPPPTEKPTHDAPVEEHSEGGDITLTDATPPPKTRTVRTLNSPNT